MIAPIRFGMPENACDCHVHVLQPGRFPYAATRTYTPPGASAAELLALEDALGVRRVIVVQPSVYGVDNSCLLDALRQLGARARGVAVIDANTPDSTLDALGAAGVRGVRLNLEAEGVHDPAVSARRLVGAADRVRARGWHVQVATKLPVIAAMADTVTGLGVPVVFDHFAGARARDGSGQPGFDTLLRMLRSGTVYLKLSAAHRLSERTDCADMAGIARPLIDAAPDRMLWASDWPHTAPQRPGHTLAEMDPFFDIDDGQALGLLEDWAPSPETRRMILAGNPARLYGF